MARKLRVEYADAIYHLMNRGDRREPIFKDDADRERFLETLAEACGKTQWQIHAYCLMTNHFHLVVETPQANLVAGMKWFLGTFTSRFNRRHRLSGHLFSGRYKSLVVGELGIGRDEAAGRRRVAEATEERRARDKAGEWKSVRKGWFLGAAGLKEQLLEQMGTELGRHHGGPEKRETDAQKAERIVGSELRKRHWTEQDLKERRKTDARKVKLALRLRRETEMTLDWIAQRLHMACRDTLANWLRGWN